MLPEQHQRPYRTHFIKFAILLICVLELEGSFSNARPIENDEAKDMVNYRLPVAPAELFQFMRRYGYLETAPALSESLYSEEAVIEAIKDLQKFGGLNQTGELSNDTLQLLVSPRCGVPDVTRSSSVSNRRKRYVVGGVGWRKQTVTYQWVISFLFADLL